MLSVRILSIAAKAEESSFQSEDAGNRVELAWFAGAPESDAQPADGPEPSEWRDRGPFCRNCSSQNASSAATAARYCAKRGGWNLGSLRRRSSPVKVESAFNFACEQAAAERAIGERRDIVFGGIGQHIPFPHCARRDCAGGWMVCSGATARKASICATSKLLTPMARIFPALNSLPKVSAVSAIGVASSGLCT